MPSSTEREFSAGGVVVRRASGGPECVVIVPSRPAASGAPVLALPKGHPEPGESAEQAARARCARRPASRPTPSQPLGEVRYWYQRDGHRIAKVVRFFLLRHRTGDPALHHDAEIENARWMALDEARTALTYPGERRMADLALSQLRGVE